MDLIGRSQTGDGDAFAALFEQYKNLVYRTAYLITGSAEDAEDTLQEVFLKVHHALRGFDPTRGAFTTWLYRITVNHCLNRLRKARPAFVALAENHGRAPSPESQLAEDDALEQALGGLSEKLRTVVVLRYYADLPYADIAEILCIPLGTVKSRLSQALETLRRTLKYSDQETWEASPARGKGGVR